MDWINIATAFASLSSVFGIFLLFWQLRQQAKISRSAFLDKIAEDAEKYLPMFVRIDIEGDLFEECCLTNTDKQQIIKILNFFERLQIFLNDGAVEFAPVDRMFSYRFFSMVHNVNVQRQIIRDPRLQPYWGLIDELRLNWVIFRQQRSADIPFLDRFEPCK